MGGTLLGSGRIGIELPSGAKSPEPQVKRAKADTAIEIRIDIAFLPRT